MIGYRSRFRENDDLPPWQGAAVRKKPPFSNARALITFKIMRSRVRNAILGNDLIQLCLCKNARLYLILFTLNR